MKRRTALYARTSAADLGARPADLWVELRRYVGTRDDLDVISEHGDAGPWLQGRRLGWGAVLAAVDADHQDGDPLIQVLVVPALRQLGRNLVEVVQALMHLSQRRVALVALGERRATPDGGERIEGMIDTTNPLGAAKLEGLLAVLLPIQAALRREHAQVARIRSSRGGDGFGRPRLAIAPLEVRGLWEGTSSRRPQSTREIAKSLGVGPTSIRKVLAELKAAGELDEARRRANIERLGGPKRGGREKSKSRLTVERVFEGLLAGTTTTQDLAEKLGCSTAVIRRHLARLRKDGRIREAQP